MINESDEQIWVDVIEAIPGLGCNTSTIPLNGPLPIDENMQVWLESLGFCDILDYRIVIGDWVMSWTSPELEWLWIEKMTQPYIIQSG